MTTHYTDTLISTIRNRYNPENDVIPGAPMVTYIDWALLTIIDELKERIERLEADMAEVLEDNPCE